MPDFPPTGAVQFFAPNRPAGERPKSPNFGRWPRRLHKSRFHNKLRRGVSAKIRLAFWHSPRSRPPALTPFRRRTPQSVSDTLSFCLTPCPAFHNHLSFSRRLQKNQSDRCARVKTHGLTSCSLGKSIPVRPQPRPSSGVRPAKRSSRPSRRHVIRSHRWWVPVLVLTALAWTPVVRADAVVTRE